MKQEVYESLEAISGRGNVLWGRSAVRGYSRDALGRSRGFSALPRLSSKPGVGVRLAHLMERELGQGWR